MKIEEIRAWQKAKEFAVEIHKLDFDNSDFKRIINETALQISTNIVKGFEKVENYEFLKFLYLAQESCSEVRNLIYVACELNYLNDEEKDRLIELSVETTKLIGGFINHIKTKITTSSS